MGGQEIRKATLGRIAVAALGLGAAVLVITILSHSDSNEDVNSKVFAAVILFVLFSLSSLPGFRLIERQPQLTGFGALTIGLSAAAYFVALEAFLSNGPFVFVGHVAVWTLAIVALAASQASMLLSFRRGDDSRRIDAVLLGSIIALALLAVLAIVEISEPGTEIGRRTWAVVSVLYLLGALLPPCLRLAEAEKPS
jgi:uncharacterized membrane protein